MPDRWDRIDEKLKPQAYEHGVRDFQAGVPITANPYCGSGPRAAYRQGWSDAHRAAHPSPKQPTLF